MDTSKIIKGAVNNGRYTVTAPIVKEDYGLYLQIEGVELPENYQVDFSNSEQNGTSVTMIGNADGVLIPRQFIDTGKDIFAFLYHVGANYGRTVYKFRIPNKVRPDRTDDTPTPEEQSTIDQCISALNEAVAQTAQDKADADASAQNASAGAERAEEARTDAQNYATQAEQSAADAHESASQASASATASANSASQSAQIKTDVQGMVSDAQGYAESASQSASASAQSASDAQGYAQSASASAQSASGYASQAQTSAQTAEQAKTASQAAQGFAESARDTAVQAKTDAESARDDAESARDEAQTIVDGISGALDDKAPVITDTASGSIASFSDGADNMPLKSLIVDINPIQDLSNGDPSPENICPISGWTEVDVEQMGVNVWDEETELGLLNSDGSVGPSTSRLVTKNYVPVSPNTTYCVSISMLYRGRGAFYDAEQQLISYYFDFPETGTESVFPNNGTIVANNGRYYFLFVTPSNARYMKYNFGAVFGNHDISINYPSTDHSYHPYAGRSITINLGQTVYGGKLDVLSGELVITHKGVDMGTLDWMYITNDGDPYFRASIGARKQGYNNLFCSSLKVMQTSGTSRLNNVAIVGSTNWIYVFVRWFDYTDAASFKTAMNGVQLVYELATPLTVQLTPNQVNSLLGVNNIWSDSGDTEAVYRADTKLFIERLTAPDSEDMVADSNITSGQYFMVGNSLYKATANIANGSAIIVGTNCIRKSLSEALNEINA